MAAQENSCSNMSIESFNNLQISGKKSLDRIIQQLGLPHLPTKPTVLRNLSKVPESATAAARIDKNYILQPGDQLGIALSGKEEKYFTVAISPDGQIYLPEIGHLQIAGLSITRARFLIDKTVRKRLTNFSVQLSVISTGLMRVHITGRVVQPGQYYVQTGATFIEILQQCGGYLPDANIREIEVTLENGTVKIVDLYEEHFAKYPPAKTLSVNARIKIGSQHNWYAVDGNIAHPGLYQLAANKNLFLSEALEWAGVKLPGELASGILVNRIHLQRRKLISVTKMEWSAFLIRTGDIIICPQTNEIESKTVSIKGEIRRPGNYRWASDMHLSDVLKIAGGLSPKADSSYCDLTITDDSLNIASFIADPAAALTHPHGKNDPLISGEAKIYIRTNQLLNRLGIVTLRGEFNYSGQYTITKNKTHLAEILNRAGGFRDTAQKRGIRILRKFEQNFSSADVERFDRLSASQLSKTEYEHLLLANDLRQLGQITLSGKKLFDTISPNENPRLRDGDVIFVPAKTDLVYLAGRVGRPGGIKFTQGFNFDDYIKNAGGFAWDADKSEIKIIRFTGEIQNAKKNTPISTGDIIWVPVKRGSSRWANFRDLVAVATQLATIFLIIDRARTE